MTIIIAIIIGLTIGVALRGLGVMLLWNWLMPGLVDVPEVSFLEGTGLFLLAMFIFGSVFDGSRSLSNTDKKKSEKEKLHGT